MTCVSMHLHGERASVKSDKFIDPKKVGSKPFSTLKVESQGTELTLFFSDGDFTTALAIRDELQRVINTYETVEWREACGK